MRAALWVEGMQIRLRYFAAIRETLGRADETREVDAGTTVSALFDLLEQEEPRLGMMRRSTLLMVNQEYVPPSHKLRDGDEVALIPPVSGGDAVRRLVRVQSQPLDSAEVEAAVADGAAGAIVVFAGTVRDHARGRQVEALEYEAYGPAAEKMMDRITDEIAARWGIDRVAMVHRTGRLGVGEASVVIAVSAAHRGEAFAACAYAIERLKEIVPIWKKEHYADGAAWVGSEAEYQREARRSVSLDGGSGMEGAGAAEDSVVGS